MAKKYRSSHRVHGLHPVKSQAIRWLGAFGHGSSVESIAEFELNPRREVSCEIIPEGRVSHIHAKVGLLIDQGRTHLVAGYAGDAWTCDSKKMDELGEALPDRPRQFSTDWSTVGGLYKTARRVECGGRYIEGVVSGPRYRAVAVKRGSTPSAFAFADRLAKAMGLEVVEVSL
jgi:hypothetical protein